MRLKPYFLVAGATAVMLFGGAPAFADEAATPSPSSTVEHPWVEECLAENPLAENPHAEEFLEECLAENPHAEEFLEECLAENPQAEECVVEGIDEAGRPFPVPADPNYTG